MQGKSSNNATRIASSKEFDIDIHSTSFEITSLKKTIEVSNASNSRSSVDYQIELFPGQVFDGWYYYWSENGTDSANLKTNSNVSWLTVTPVKFTSTACTVIPVKYSFTAPNNPGIYQVTIADSNGNWSNIVVELIVSNSPTIFTITKNVQLTLGQSASYYDTLIWHGFDSIGCSSPYTPSLQRNFFYKTEPTVPWLSINPSNTTITLNDTSIVTKKITSNTVGTDSTYDIQNRQWSSYPHFTRWIVNTNPPLSDTISDFNFSDFNSIPNIKLNGNAIQSGNKLRLTDNLTSMKGSAWYLNKVNIQDAFETVFQFQISQGVFGADGFAFVIQNMSNSALGLDGGNIGYSGITNSIAIEFDTFINAENEEPNSYHISVNTGGHNANSSNHSFSLGATTNIPNLRDGQIHKVKIQYIIGKLYIYIDDLTNPVLYLSIDIRNAISLDSGKAWVGFTSSTGGYSESHDILNWYFKHQTKKLAVKIENLTASVEEAVVQLTWQKSGDEQSSIRSYRIYRGIDSSKVSLIDSSISTLYLDSIQYLPPKSYYFVTAIDSLFRESDASSTASVTIGASAAGNMTQFDPVNHSTVVIEGWTLYDAAYRQNFTVEGWIYRNSLIPGGQRIFDKNYAGSPDQWTIDMGSDLKVRWTSGPYDLTGTNQKFTSKPIALNGWSHVAVSVNGTTVKMYINGEKVGGGELTGYYVGDGSKSVQLGAPISSGNAGNTEFFSGYMDEVRFWAGEVPQELIRKRMYHPVNGKEPKLLAYYSMNGNESGQLINIFNESKGGVKMGDGVGHAVVMQPSTAPISKINKLLSSNDSINFGDVKINDSAFVLVNLRAVFGDVWVSQSKVKTPEFNIPKSEYYILDRDTLKLKVGMFTTKYGNFSDTLTLINESTSGMLKIPIKGMSLQPTLMTSLSKIVLHSNNLVDTSTATLIFRQQTVNFIKIDSIYTTLQNIKLSLQAKQFTDSSKLLVTFAPLKYGRIKDTLYVLSNATNSVIKIPIEANVPYPTVIFGASLNFGNIALEDSLEQMVLLGSPNPNGTNFDDIHTNTQSFSVSPGSANITSKDTLKLRVKYKPNKFNVLQDTLTIGSSSNGSATMILLIGNSPYPTIIPLQKSIQFTNVLVNTNQKKVFSLTNSSINYLTVITSTVSEPQFKVEGRSFDGVIKRGDTLGITLSFQSESPGTFKDTLLLITDAITDTVRIPLTATSVLTNVSVLNDLMPIEYSLSQNYPNPFNPATTIQFGLPEASNVSLKIYDVLGREVATLVNENLSPGYFNYSWHAGGLASGMYIYRITALSLNGEKKQVFNQVKKLLLLR